MTRSPFTKRCDLASVQTYAEWFHPTQDYDPMESVESCRRYFLEHPDMLAEIAPDTAKRVHDGTVCVCCGMDDVELMDCGHLICSLCVTREHDKACIACALAG